LYDTHGNLLSESDPLNNTVSYTGDRSRATGG
jgi:YD repeat-containing protein